jgi:hypothetical protein
MTPADLAESMVDVACELACLVRDEDPGPIAEFLDRYTAEEDSEARALFVVLAAMMPVEDASPADLLAWAEPDRDRAPAVTDAGDGTFSGRRMAEYARHRADGMCVRRAGLQVWVSLRTATRYEAALVAAGKATWRAAREDHAAAA